jgi:hypothetical protein
MSNFKNVSIKDTAGYVMAELNCTEIEAVSKLQAVAARNHNEELLEDLCEYKNTLISALV